MSTVWLRQCLDRAEQKARAAAPGPWVYQDIDSVGGGRVCDPTVAIAHVEYDVDRVDPRIRRSVYEAEADATGEYIAAHDPQWRLDDLARKRLILAECESDLRQRGGGALEGRVDRATWTILGQLAAEFAHEPGYDDEVWAQDGAR